jgi:hypothetical protein
VLVLVVNVTNSLLALVSQSKPIVASEGLKPDKVCVDDVEEEDAEPKLPVKVANTRNVLSDVSSRGMLPVGGIICIP